jgi:predicted PurR-regulated permease PerM
MPSSPKSPLTSAKNIFAPVMPYRPHSALPTSGVPRPFLLILLTAVGYGCYLLARPFSTAIIFASVAAALAYPLHSQIHRRISNQNLAALLSTTSVAMVFIVFMAVIAWTLASGVHEMYDSSHFRSDEGERLGAYLLGILSQWASAAQRYIPISIPDVRSTLTGQIQHLLTTAMNSVALLIGEVVSGFLNILICVFILFFFFRDGRKMVRGAYILLPLKIEQSKAILHRIKDTFEAIVYGTLLIACLQGGLTGLAFWMLGLNSPVLWAGVTGLCALLPVIGTGFVLAPAVAMLAFSGHAIKAAILLGWGLFIVHPVDNVIRPYLIGGRAKLPTLFVFFALLGGLWSFGPKGAILGPLILAVAAALFDFLRDGAHSRKQRSERRSCRAREQQTSVLSEAKTALL